LLARFVLPPTVWRDGKKCYAPPMTTERLLLGPGPSPVSARVMRALSEPVLSHLDPEMMLILDHIRRQLGWAFGAADGAFSLAISGTGTSGMEAAVANVTAPGARVLVVVTGYFGDRLAQIFQRYGANVTRLDVEWGRACDPAAVERALAATPADIVAVVHAETSTGVLNPVQEIARVGSDAGALTVVDAVTSLGGMPLRTEDWAIDVCYSCSQKGLGAPSGMAPLSFSPRALAKKTASRSFYLDLALLEDYWVRRKYHHTISAPLVYALREALAVVEEEGLENRWARHRRNHLALAAGLEALGLSLLPPAPERLWTLNAVRVPDGVDEAAVRRRLLDEFAIEVGAGLGPLAGRIWRVGLMGAGSSLANVLLFLSALERALTASGYRAPAVNAAMAAAESAAAT
jgi:alanine-glyoxylate transaminase/serine-glyoxylate transaminase/serine-pyruvate transaminase